MVVKRMQLFLILVLLITFGINTVCANSIAYPPVYTLDSLTIIICVVVIAVAIICAIYTIKVIKKNSDKKMKEKNNLHNDI